MPGKKRLRSQKKEMVMGVYQYFEKVERNTKGRNATSHSSLRRTAEAITKYLYVEVVPIIEKVFGLPKQKAVPVINF